MDRRVDPTLLLPPPSWNGDRESWPPTVEEAMRSLRGSLYNYPARYVVLACAIAAAAADESDLLRAYSLLCRVTNIPGDGIRGMRAVAAVNMAPVLGCLGTEGALLVAVKELREAAQFADAVEGLPDLFLSAEEALAKSLSIIRQRAPLRFMNGRRCRLVAMSDAARGRIDALPRHPIDGAWFGVRAILRNHGLDAPAACPVSDPVSLVVVGDEVGVRPWKAQARSAA